jgi:hypothetical protein
MNRLTLLDIDPDLRNPEILREWLIRNVATSTAVETGASVKTISNDLRRFVGTRSRRAQKPRSLAIDSNSRRIGS